MKALLLCFFIFSVTIAQNFRVSPQPLSFTCPSLCICAGYKCISCKNDRLNDPRTNCTVCYPGYSHGNMGCIGPGSNAGCPLPCYCRPQSDKCNKCIDPYADPKTNCSSCLAGYHNESQSQCVKNSCPKGCKCIGFVPWTCTGCIDPNTDSNSNCTSCLAAYHQDNKGKCIENKCPPGCRCFGFVPWGCTGCIDIHKTMESNCKKCATNYTLGRDGICKWNVPWCPEDCVCNGIRPGCATCKLEHFSVKTNCTKCEDGYSYFYSDMYGTKECRPVCMKGCDCSFPNTCAACKDTMMGDLSTNCTTCKAPYEMKPSGHCGVV